MCRHVAYLGPPVSLFDLLIRPAHSLVDQARSPRFQHGDTAIVNPDGYGIGWYDDGAVPHRRRRAEPIWEDETLAGATREITTTTAVAAVRLASPGSPVELASNAPLLSPPWLFSLNGFVKGYHDGASDELRARVSKSRRPDIEGSADTGVLFALVLDRIDAGASPGEAIAGVATEVARDHGGRLNLLLTDGRRVAATAWGNSLFVRDDLDASYVASEPLDHDPAWTRVEDRMLVEGASDALRLIPL